MDKKYHRKTCECLLKYNFHLAVTRIIESSVFSFYQSFNVFFIVRNFKWTAFMFLTGSVFFFLFFLSFGSHSECFHTKSLSDPFQLHFARLFNIQRNAGIAVLNCNSRESIFKNYYQLLHSSLNASCPLRSDIPSIPSFFFYLRALVLRTDCICYKNEPSTTILINQLYMQCLICMIDFCNSTRNFRGFLYKIVSITLTQKKKKKKKFLQKPKPAVSSTMSV